MQHRSTVVWQSAPKRPLDFGMMPSAPMIGSAPLLDRLIFDQFCEVAGRTPDALALDDGNCSLSYGQLLMNVRCLSEAINVTVPPGCVVGIAVTAAVWLPLAMLACLRSGTPFLVVDPRDPPGRQHQILLGGSVALLIHDDATPECVAAACQVCRNIHHYLSDVPASAVETVARGSVDDPAIILYTSGSTGLPKGIVNSQRAILQRVSQYVASCHIGSHDRLLPLAGLITIAGLREMFAALLSGAVLDLVRLEDVGLSRLKGLVAARRPTIIYAVPSILRRVVAPASSCDFSSLRVVRIGGEQVRWSDISAARRAFPTNCVLQIGYSSTESTGSQWFVPPDLSPDCGPVPIGYMLPGAEFAIQSPNGSSAGSATVGELLIRGRSVALGEWRDGRLWPGVADGADPAVRIHATGDLVRADAGGLLRFVGRNDLQVKRNGIRFEIEEIEVQLLCVVGVEDVGVLTSTSGDLIAFVAIPIGHNESIEAKLRDRLRATLPHGLQPTRLHIVGAIPRLLSGKVDRRQLNHLDELAVRAATRGRRDNATQASRIDRAISSAWSAVLPHSRRPEACWDEEGGDSLGLLSFVTELESRLGPGLPLELFRTDMSRADFARVIGECEVPAAVFPPDRPTLFFFPGEHGDVPMSARFRFQMASRVASVTMRYPGLEAILKTSPLIEDIGKTLADDVDRAQPSGALFIVGYSFGGAVAAEAAAQLIAKGRAIAFLCILDTDISGVRRPIAFEIGRMVRQWREFPLVVDRKFIRLLTNGAVRLHLGKAILSILDQAPASNKSRAPLIRKVEASLRRRIFREWIARNNLVLSIPATLFQSEEFRPNTPRDLGWAPRVSTLDIIPFRGDHTSCIADGTYSVGNCELFLSALTNRSGRDQESALAPPGDA